jgi:hypothetical protein
MPKTRAISPPNRKTRSWRFVCKKLGDGFEETGISVILSTASVMLILSARGDAYAVGWDSEDS